MKKLFIYLFLSLSLFSNELVEIYLPNGEWKLIGVPGPFYEGSSTADTFSSTSWYEAKDLNAGQKYIALTDTAGTVSICDETSDVLCFSLEDSSYSQVILASEVNNSLIDAYIPRRDMFISFDGGVDMNISYQADLEGNPFEIKLFSSASSSTFYEGVLNSSYGYSNPTYLTEKTGTSSTYTMDLRNDSVVDWNLSNNPGKRGIGGTLSDYEENNNRDSIDTSRSEYIQLYSLNSVGGYWEVFNSGYSDTYNDFTELESGKGYWARTNNGINGETGLILGDGNISTESYTGSLGSGWNLISFPSGKIRESSTGLVLSGASTIGTNDKFTISDEFGTESIEIEIFKISASGVSTYEIVSSINSQIAGEIEDGNLSEDFNIRAFALNDSTSNNAKFLFLSDKRFRIYDSGDDVFDEVNTTGGQNPYNLYDYSYDAISDLDGNGTMSRYGEYSFLVVPPNDGSGNLDGVKGKVQVNSNTAIDMNGQTTIADFATQMETDTDIDKAIPVDLDLDGNMDSVLLVNKNEPFSIRDVTFTKIYRVDDTAHNDVTLYFNDGTDDETFSSFAVSNGDNAGTIATTFNGQGFADMSQDSSGSFIYITTTNTSYQDFEIFDSESDDILTRIISIDDNNVTGTIQKVYTISELAKTDLNKSIYSINFKTTGGGNVGTDDFLFKIDGVETSNVLTGTGMKAGEICIDLATQINSLDVPVYAECNTSVNSDLNVTVTITGYFTQAGLKENDANITGTNGDNAYDYASDFGSYGIGGATINRNNYLTSDLRYTALYTPDFPTSKNSLSYIRENNYSIAKMLTAVNNVDGSTISWKYIDLTSDTSDTSDWFSQNNGFDLFEIEQDRGYFVYLDEENSSDLTITATLDLEFSQQFNNDNNSSGFSKAGEVQNLPEGVLKVEVSGDSGDETRVIATIQGDDYKMVEGTSSYSLSIDLDNMPNLYQWDSNITISAYDLDGDTGTKQMELNLSAPATPVFGFFEQGKILFLGTTSSDLEGFHIYSGNIDERYPTPTNIDGTTYVKNLISSNDYKTAGSEYCYDLDGSGSGCASGYTYGMDLYVRSLVSGKESEIGDYGVSGNAKVYDYTTSSVGRVENSTDSLATLYFLTYNICEDAPDFDTNNTGWKFTAYDRTGSLSNIQFLPDWYAIYKNASILGTHKNDLTTDNRPRIYDSSCTPESSNSVKDNGVVLIDSTSDDTNISIAYENITSASITQAHADRLGHTYITYGAGTYKIGRVQFSASHYLSEYNGDDNKTLIIDINNTMVFATTFDDLNASGGTFNISNNSKCKRLDSNQSVMKGY